MQVEVAIFYNQPLSRMSALLKSIQSDFTNVFNNAYIIEKAYKYQTLKNRFLKIFYYIFRKNMDKI